MFCFVDQFSCQYVSACSDYILFCNILLVLSIPTSLYYKLVGIDLKSALLWVKILTMRIDISTTSYSSELSNQNQTGLL